jgi:3' terminal RNA ribose 2'-O-methyltransferase Hen1
MLLTITSTQTPATDLGYLLHKHPARCQSFKLSCGQAHVFYPEVSEARCTAALLLDIDPVTLVRGRKAFSVSQYVNDRPYVASSLLSVAIAQVYTSALNGRCQERPDAVQKRLSLEAQLEVVPCKEGDELLRQLFEPLGYQVETTPHPLDTEFPAWGESPYYTLKLTGQVRLSDLLSHLYVLIPVLDDEKHYWVGEEEIDKLLHRGAGWLSSHPAQALIVRRYLKSQRALMQQAQDRLISAGGDMPETTEQDAEESIEAPLSLNQQRLDAAMKALMASTPRRVLDLGCGEGKLIQRLLQEHTVSQIVGMDVSHKALERAHKRLHLDRLPQNRRPQLLHGSLVYSDARLSGFDAAAILEVIEHLDLSRLQAFERVVFERARPGMVVITTPNKDYNRIFGTLPAGKFRHPDHRFEWTREEFQTWAERLAAQYGYRIEFRPIGPVDPQAGSPTQMGVFVQTGETT